MSVSLDSGSSRVLVKQVSSNTLERQLSSKSFEKQKTIVDGIEFTSAADHNKFSFKRTNTTTLQDEISDDSNSTASLDEDIPEGKHRNFEFTSNLSLMRVIRACLFFQVIALICDNPDVQFPPLFNVLCRSPLYYSIRFYSRPFLDIVYLVQLFGMQIYDIARGYLAKYWSGNFEITFGFPSRRLSAISR